MNTPGDYHKQLADLTVLLTGAVAERLYMWSKDIDQQHRNRILNMIEDNLPTVITNAIAKSPSLHSATGVQYLEQHLDDIADTWAKKFIGKD